MIISDVFRVFAGDLCDWSHFGCLVEIQVSN